MTKEEIEFLKEMANDKSVPADERKLYKDELKKAGISVGGGSKKKSTKKKSTKKKATKKKLSSESIAELKKKIKETTGKTEKECEDIIAQYKALRTKTNSQKKKQKKSAEKNKKRVSSLKKKGDIIKGTDEKTADATLKTTKKEVKDKVEKEIKVIEKQVKKQVNKTNLKPADNKKAVDKKVKSETKKVAKKMVVDTSGIITAITTSLAQHDKDSAKEFLLKLRSDIDKLIKKYVWGGELGSNSYEKGGEITQEKINNLANRLIEESEYYYELEEDGYSSEVIFEKAQEEAEEMLERGEDYEKGGIISFSDGFIFKEVSKEYAKKNWNKREIFGINQSEETEGLIDSSDDLEDFDTFGIDISESDERIHKGCTCESVFNCDCEGDENYKKGGRLKSALMRDRKYVSEQEWEQRYSKGKNRPRYKKKNKFVDGGTTSELFELVIDDGGKAEDLAIELNNDGMVGEPDFEWEYDGDDVYTYYDGDDFDLLNRYAVGVAESNGFNVQVSQYAKGGIVKEDLMQFNEDLDNGESVVVVGKDGLNYIYQGTTEDYEGVAITDTFDRLGDINPETTYQIIPLSQIEEIKIDENIFAKGGKILDNKRIPTKFDDEFIEVNLEQFVNYYDGTDYYEVRVYRDDIKDGHTWSRHFNLKDARKDFAKYISRYKK